MSLKHKFRPIKLDPQRVARAEAEGARVSAEDAVPAPSQPPAVKAEGAPIIATPPADTPAAPPGDAGLGTSQTAGPRWEEGRVYEVPHERIRPNPVNPRVFYTAEAIVKMAESLRAEGQTTAATGYVEDDHVVLIEGQTRQRASQQLGWPTLRVEIRPKPESIRTLYETARAANDARTNPSNLDEALRWKELLEQGVYPSQRSLAAALRIHEADVSRVLSLARMPQSILQALAEVPALLAARTLASIRAYWETCGDDRTLELVAQARSRGLGFREIDSLRKAAEKGPSRRPHASRLRISFGGGKGELKTFEDGRIQLLLEGLTAEEAKELQLRLQNVLEA
ncbi:ParB/RepB/Spo0J family partition protein [Azohydromonas caseinilytica]|uniref:ParB/RepB/Spo0J family partition protein n=1 Tax=Azohydromonas caseinilytica TaxID=2728836 RepID=A0A848FHG5_9BURK|nr:ParB/RepB/Spo0J family partition protein [Azohydromonas caseinilytica]NML18702.1 ParB/RepB/Spo0J family partition protein [Azohydromonas caseinilytica]